MDTSVRKTAFLFVFFLLTAVGTLRAQQPGVYLSGAVLDADSLSPLRGATIKNLSTHRDIRADERGFFRIQVSPGDTLQIQQMTYKPGRYLVPTGLRDSEYMLMQLLQKDRVAQHLSQRAFPTQLQFEQALLQANPGNLTDKTAQLDVSLERVTQDPTHMQKYIDDYMRYQQLYVLPERGAPNNFINPERWTYFIRDWQQGRFNEKGLKKLGGFPAGVKEEKDQ